MAAGPEFVIVGAARSGTTSLHYYLDQHPDIAMSATKEPNYFAFRPGSDGRAQPMIHPDPRIVGKSVTDPDRYQGLWPPARPGLVRGEASPLYLYVPDAPARIAEDLPDVRLVAILRQPAERAWSHFLHTYRGAPEGAEAWFAAAIAPELALTQPDHYTPWRSGTHVLRLGRYAHQIERYHGAFGPDRLLVLLYDELQADTPAVLARVCAHVGVDAGFDFDTSVVYNRAGVVAGRGARVLRAVRTRVQPVLKQVLPTNLAGRLGELRARREQPATAGAVPGAIRERLDAYYADDLERLEVLLGLDLSRWKSAGS